MNALVPFAAAGAGHESGAVPTVLLALAFAIVCAKLAGELAERLGQPAVLGELIVGILAGNAALFGGPDLSALASSETLTVMAELGAVLLLFHVGLESTPKEMMAVGGRAALVAVVGVVTPMLLGFGVGELMRPDEPWMLHAFLGAMLAATSVGITARVLKDVDALRAPFARIILGAAVIDDVLGLVVLAVVAGIITAAASGAALSAASVAWIVAKALAFLVGALVVGSFVSPRVFRGALALRSRGVGRRSGQMHIERDLVGIGEARQHLSRQMAVRIVDLVEVMDPVRFAPQVSPRLRDPSPHLAQRRAGQRAADQRSDVPAREASRHARFSTAVERERTGVRRLAVAGAEETRTRSQAQPGNALPRGSTSPIAPNTAGLGRSHADRAEQAEPARQCVPRRSLGTRGCAR